MGWTGIYSNLNNKKFVENYLTDRNFYCRQ